MKDSIDEDAAVMYRTNEQWMSKQGGDRGKQNIVNGVKPTGAKSAPLKGALGAPQSRLSDFKSVYNASYACDEAIEMVAETESRDARCG